MKKRLLSMLLCLCLVSALFCGMTVSASADNTQQYTLQAGDTVLGVCQKLGIDFYANQDWITKNNNIGSYTNLKAGMVLILPIGNKAAAGTAAAAANTAAAPANGTVSYYLVEHTMAAGETVYMVCKQLGVDFNANSEKIKTINGITNYNNLKVGTKLLLPSTSAPTSGSYTSVIAHKVAAGETAGSICKTYGVDYGKNAETIKALSGIENLSVIKAGQTLYLPVAGKAGTAAPAAGTAAAGTAGAAAPATVNTTPKAGSFKVHTSSNGVFTLQVNGQIVNSAKPGETVTVVAVPDQGYKVNQIVVYKTSTTERITVTNSSFTMPANDITIYVTFKADT